MTIVSSNCFLIVISILRKLSNDTDLSVFILKKKQEAVYNLNKPNELELITRYCVYNFKTYHTYFNSK